MICNKMGVKTLMSHSKYLGFSIMLGRSKNDILALVIERVRKKIKVWKDKFLSRAWKDVVIKVVA